MRKKIVYLLSFFILLIIGTSFVFINSTKSYPQGTLVVSTNNRHVYYIGSDGRKYAITDYKTYLSWYSSFNYVKRISKSEFDKIPDADTRVTARPGLNIIKFDGSKGLYAIQRGAVLRRIKDEKQAVEIFGRDWRDKVIVLSSWWLKYYKVGDSLDHAEDFNPIDNFSRVKSINDSLVQRGFIDRGSKSSSENIQFSKIKLIQEDLSDRFSPNFHPDTSGYSMSASYAERSITLKPTAYDSSDVITINGIRVSSGQESSFKLNEGINTIKLKVKQSDKKETIYNISVFRASPSSAATLKDIKDNLSGSLVPGFSKDIYEYEINAKNSERRAEFKPYLSDSKAKLYVNGQEWESEKTYGLNLEKGDNWVRFRVFAEDGTYKNYKINVNRSGNVDYSDVSLRYIKTNLENSLNPSFERDEASYTLKANNNEDKVNVEVEPVNGNSIVAINGEERRSANITIHEGTTVEIEVVSPDGLRRIYKIEVKR